MTIDQFFDILQRRLEISEPSVMDMVTGTKSYQRWMDFLALKGVFLAAYGDNAWLLRREHVARFRALVDSRMPRTGEDDFALSDRENYFQALHWIQEHECFEP